MSRETGNDRSFVAAQQRMLRLAARDHGLTPLAIELETGIPKRTVKSWCEDGASAMSGPNLVALARVMPNELLSLLFEPAGKHFCDDKHEDSEFGELLTELLALAGMIASLRSDNPSPQQKANLADIARRVASKCSGVAK